MPNSDHPSKRAFDRRFTEVPGFRRLILWNHDPGRRSVYRHANGNGCCGSAHPIEHYPLPHLGSDPIVRLTFNVINHKADDGRPEI
jgi:hypothetical protein